jgi:hypothetical protein
VGGGASVTANSIVIKQAAQAGWSLIVFVVCAIVEVISNR